LKGVDDSGTGIANSSRYPHSGKVISMAIKISPQKSTSLLAMPRRRPKNLNSIQKNMRSKNTVTSSDEASAPVSPAAWLRTWRPSPSLLAPRGRRVDLAHEMDSTGWRIYPRAPYVHAGLSPHHVRAPASSKWHTLSRTTGGV